MVSTESKEYAEVSACQRIAENNRIITDFQSDRLLEKCTRIDTKSKNLCLRMLTT